MQEEPTIIVPPDTMEDDFQLNWDEIDSSVRTFPKEYPLKVQANEKQHTKNEDGDDLPLIPMVCHRVKVQR